MLRRLGVAFQLRVCSLDEKYKVVFLGGMTQTPKDIIKLFPTVAQCANDLESLTPHTVAPVAIERWKNRNSIPSKYAYGLFTALRLRGHEINAEDFLRALSRAGRNEQCGERSIIKQQTAG